MRRNWKLEAEKLTSAKTAGGKCVWRNRRIEGVHNDIREEGRGQIIVGAVQDVW